MRTLYPFDEDFQDYFRERVKNRIIDENDDRVSYGITLLVIGKGGIESLSPKQLYIFTNKVLKDNIVEECSHCRNAIPWCEMEGAIDSGKCSWCYKLTA